MGHGGKRKGAGRKVGSIIDNVKMGISISRENAEWLRSKKQPNSWLIEKAINILRDCDNCLEKEKCVNYFGMVNGCGFKVRR